MDRKSIFGVIFPAALAVLLLTPIFPGCRKKSQPSESRQEEAESLPAAQGPSLDEEAIRTLFAEPSEETETEEASALDNIQWEQGAFSARDAHEAVVSFYDGSQAHAMGTGEVWLLRYDGGWKLIAQLENADFASFNLIDIDQDGRSEIWLDAGAMHFGNATSRGSLVKIEGNEVSTLYSCDGFDNTGALEEGAAVCKVFADFQNLDDDPVLEIVETETIATYQNISEEYQEVSSTSTVSVYKLKDGQYEKTEMKSP